MLRITQALTCPCPIITEVNNTGIEVTTNIDIPRVLKKIDNDAFWTYAAGTWHKLYRHYVPCDTGQLYNNVIIRPKEIEHCADHATKVYVNNRNYRIDKHIFATSQWDKHAAPSQGQKLVSAMQKYVDRGMR